MKIKSMKLITTFAGKRDFYTNVIVRDGVMTAQNEVCGISIDTNIDLNFCCNAKMFTQSFNENSKLAIENNHLMINSGRFNANIPLVPEFFIPEAGEGIPVQGNILEELKGLVPFAAQDDARIALNGVAISHGYIRASNGHMAIRKAVECDIDEIIIPIKIIPMLAKVVDQIQTVSVYKKTVLFNFNGGRVFTKTIDKRMPDLDRTITKVNQNYLSDDLVDAVRKLEPLCNGVITLGNTISTKGASIEGFDLPECSFNPDYLIKIFKVADSLDLSEEPYKFEGEGINGVIVGIRR